MYEGKGLDLEGTELVSGEARNWDGDQTQRPRLGARKGPFDKPLCLSSIMVIVAARHAGGLVGDTGLGASRVWGCAGSWRALGIVNALLLSASCISINLTSST